MLRVRNMSDKGVQNYLEKFDMYNGLIQEEMANQASRTNSLGDIFETSYVR